MEEVFAALLAHRRVDILLSSLEWNAEKISSVTEIIKECLAFVDRHTDDS